ncbi:methyltransferase domain-containing protein [uncultured Brevundimonas sp.]|uniref:class I SAM-dependent methyltransferase n=1 Tax=uncultured Brevundimonas sp. TaxID=213418 RepID=UPI0030EECFE4|tara:strand:+ start:7212 stop:7892 length:681 start_codon:yes stop_codon:yes gene_type:complete
MKMQKRQVADLDFTPAAGHHWLTPFYDFGLAVLTRERRWRDALIAQMQPAGADVIADFGCGTGSLLVKIALAQPSATLIGIDPDPTVLALAKAKLARAGANAELLQGFGRDANRMLSKRSVTKIVSSLVFHQVSMAEKSAALAAGYTAMSSGGELHIADYGLQRTPLMRGLFRATVQKLDGFENTQPQADGVLPELILAAGFSEVEETQVIQTPSGSISLIRANRR